MNTTERKLISMLIVFSIPYLAWRLGLTGHWAPLVLVQKSSACCWILACAARRD